jgi:hypothetical protein
MGRRGVCWDSYPAAQLFDKGSLCEAVVDQLR